MFDNLRDDNDSAFYEEDDSVFQEEDAFASVPVAPKRRADTKLLGMTSMQRFVIATMLLIAVCTLGMMCLLITGRIGLL